jgi:hypothetical protein
MGLAYGNERQRSGAPDVKNSRHRSDATNASVKLDAFAAVLRVIILILHRHPVTVCHFGLRSHRWHNRHRKRWQGQREQEKGKEKVAEHSCLYHVKH